MKPTEPTADAVRLMEPAIAELGFLSSLGEAAQVSVAISMKRIADFVCGSAINADVVQYLSDQSWRIQP